MCFYTIIPKGILPSEKIELDYNPPSLHIGREEPKNATQTLENLIFANLKDKIGFTVSINQALRVVQFTIHTGPKVTQVELKHNRSPRTELTNKVKYNSYLSDWKTLNVSLPLKQIPIYVGCNKKRVVVDHIVKARKRNIPYCSSLKSPTRRMVEPVKGSFSIRIYFWSEKS